MYFSVQLCIDLLLGSRPQLPPPVHGQGLLGGAEAAAGPGDSHHLVQGQGHLGGAEADEGHPKGAELDLQCQGVERKVPVKLEHADQS